MHDLTPDELKLEQRRILRGGAFAILTTGLVLATCYYLIVPLVTLPDTLDERLAFALQADIVLALVILAAVQRVSSGRYRSAADNPGSAFGPPSERIAVDAAFLQNTLEQSFIAFVVHLAFAATVCGDPLIFIPAFCFLFVAGRVAFRLRYPRGAGARAFGMALTAVPSLIGAAVVVWSIISGWLN